MFKKNILIKSGEISVKILVLGLIGLFYLSPAFNKLDPYPSGDGVEYVVVTEAFYNHFTPEIKPGDFESFEQAINKKPRWVEFGYKQGEFNSLKSCIIGNYKKKDTYGSCGGLYPDKNGKYYGFHFFFYSLTNVPGRWIADLVNGNPLRSFQVTNAFFVIITCFIFLFFSPFNFWISIFSAIILCFSTTYWYLSWTHPEVFTTCMVAIGFLFFFKNKYYTGIFLVAIASLQNQPLIIILIFMGLIVLYKNGINIKTILKLILSGVLSLWPPIFYYYHFNTTNIIKDVGFLKTNVITFWRVFGFYFDLNQGMILAIPLLLLVYITLIVRKTVRILNRNEKFDPFILMPVFLIVMTCVVSSMVNWNHGQAVINRYATYFSAIIMIHTLFLIYELRNKIHKYTLYNYLVVTQILTVLYHEEFAFRDYMSNEHKPLAKYILDYHPSWYTPDPHIFLSRTLGPFAENMNESPVVYLRNNKKINKILVKKSDLDSLYVFGFNKDEINELKQNMSFFNGYAYINNDEYNLNRNTSYIQTIKERRKRVVMNKTIDLIYATPEWLEKEKIKAKESNTSLEKILEMDAEYLYNEQQNK